MDPISSFNQPVSPSLYGSLIGEAFRKRIEKGEILPLCGIYGAFSALIASKRIEGVFCRGFSLLQFNMAFLTSGM